MSLKKPELPLFSTPPKLGKWTEWIDKLINSTDKISTTLNAVRLKELCNDATQALGAESTCLNLKVAKDDSMILVGDIHGQFRDMYHHVLTIQSEARARGEKDRVMLFLGDYVDRGPQSVEVITMLLCLKVEYPELVYLLRGNHEDMNTCRLYGFMAECRMKLQLATWYVFTAVFAELPLAAVIDVEGRGKLFCCHGGLSPSLIQGPETLTFVVRQSYGQGNGDPNSEAVDGLLWSDPADHSGFQYNQRGCGHTFGQDTTEQFCFQNKFEFIVRAHQMAMKGFSWDHAGKLLTIFSAPNYCNVNDNLGAIGCLYGSPQLKAKYSLASSRENVQQATNDDRGDVRSLMEFYVYDVSPEVSAVAAPAVPSASQVDGGYFEGVQKDGAKTDSSAGAANGNGPAGDDEAA